MFEGLIILKKENFLSGIANKETLAYMFWGGLTAFSTVLLYFVFVNYTPLNVMYSNTLANVIGVILAYFTNKKFVFGTHNETKKEQRDEMIIFFISRLCTFVFETVLLVFIVDKLGYDKNYSKIFTSFVVVIVNFFVAKAVVFVKK